MQGAGCIVSELFGCGLDLITPPLPRVAPELLQNCREAIFRKAEEDWKVLSSLSLSPLCGSRHNRKCPALIITVILREQWGQQ